MPQPMTTTGDAAFWASEISSPHVICPLSPPSNCRSSNNNPARRSSTGRRPRKLIISSNSVARELDWDAPAVAIGGDGGQRTPAHLGHVLFRHAALDVERHPHVGLDVAPHPRQVAGHVHQRAQEGRDADLLERGGDDLVPVVERLSGESVPRHVRHPRRRSPPRQSPRSTHSPPEPKPEEPQSPPGSPAPAPAQCVRRSSSQPGNSSGGSGSASAPCAASAAW